MSKYTDIHEYIKAKWLFLNTTWRLINGDGFFVVRGNLIPEKEYFDHNPIPNYSPASPDNPDKQNVENDIVIRKDGRRRKT